jgi:hypothetical protein
MPKNKAVREQNRKHIKLTDNKGKAVPIYIAYNPDPEDKGQMMVLSTKKAKIKQDSQYTLTIDPEFQATSGARLTKGDKVSFTTLNQSLSTTVNMIIMGVMIVGMIIFSSRSMKKQMAKENQAKGKVDAVNPYKEAKKTGKSVEEIVAKDKKAKAKSAAKAKADQRQKVTQEQEKDTKRVAGPRPISASGSTYRHLKKKPAQKETKNTTRPKNQTGKQKRKNRK